MIPSLRGLLPECNDPVVGLQDIRACFAPMVVAEGMPDGTEAIRSDAAPAPAESSARTDPESKPTGPEFIGRLRDALRRIREQVGELRQFGTSPTYPWNISGVILWGSIREYERVDKVGYRGTINSTSDQVLAMAWARSIIRQLPSEQDRLKCEGFETIRTSNGKSSPGRPTQHRWPTSIGGPTWRDNAWPPDRRRTPTRVGVEGRPESVGSIISWTWRCDVRMVAPCEVACGLWTRPLVLET